MVNEMSRPQVTHTTERLVAALQTGHALVDAQPDDQFVPLPFAEASWNHPYPIYHGRQRHAVLAAPAIPDHCGERGQQASWTYLRSALRGPDGIE